MNFSAAEAALCEPGERLSRRHRVALRCVMRAWQTFQASGYDRWTFKESLTRAATRYWSEESRQEYGIIWEMILGAVVSAIIGFIVEKILKKIWPDKATAAASDFAAKLTEWSRDG